MDERSIILGCFSPPFNVHFLNILMKLRSLFTDKNCDAFPDEIEEVKSALLEISLGDVLNKSQQFLNIISIIKKVVVNIKNTNTFKKLPMEVTVLVSSLETVILSYTESTTTEEYEELLENLESQMDDVDNIDLKSALIDILEEEHLEIVESSIVDISAGIYGIMSALTPTSTWNDIFSNYTEFKESCLVINTNESR